jgi:hypothetical protein
VVHTFHSGEIPVDIVALPILKVLNISSNTIKGSIPNELGKLGGIAEVFDVSSNLLTGRIPSALGSFDGALVLLGDNQL